MTLAQRIVIANDDGRAVMAVALAALLLFSVIAVLVFVGVHPAQASAPQPAPAASPIPKADEPACKAALARARDTRGLPAEEAIAASTAMLRACGVR
ncbi:hypothetical protein [Caulobacter sp.]|uniref:hypothetical protein n=1 Tax=Caulobacter sp. TaxID=78 RepID=UPI001B120A59|nr:hypothetical protein [Caulobacter sp.]MBO9544127.1 hypothetical protein [Caulobacter sp.]